MQAKPASLMPRESTCQVPCREPPMLVHLHSDVLIIPGCSRVPLRLRPVAADAPSGMLPRTVVLMAATMAQGLALVVRTAGVPAGDNGMWAHHGGSWRCLQP